MTRKHWQRGALVAAVSALALTAGTISGFAQGTVEDHTVVVGELDNPRQLSPGGPGELIVAQAGRGGQTGKVSIVKNGEVTNVISGLKSFAEPDGSFAVGVNGASKRVGGPFYAIGIPNKAPSGRKNDVWLLSKTRGGKLLKVANISRFERNNDPDGEGVESNAYSVLALDNKVLVADAAGDYIAKVRRGKISVWAVMPEYGEKIDAVPTVLSKGADNKIYVGELHSEMPGKARVWQFDRQGNRLKSWKGFTTVTGVDRAADGTLYVSELFGGECGFNQIPECFPGRVVAVAPNGDRTYYDVPFPSGVTARGDNFFVTAFSIAGRDGAMGIPDTDGQIWKFTPNTIE